MEILVLSRRLQLAQHDSPEEQMIVVQAHLREARYTVDDSLERSWGEESGRLDSSPFVS